MAGLHEPVERILAEGNLFRVQFHFHVHGLAGKSHDKYEEDNLHNRDAGEFAGICLPQDLTNVISREEILHFMRYNIFLMDILCYTIHGISLHWLDFVWQLNCTKWAGLMLFLLGRCLDFIRNGRS